jgi:hypothetical protein
MLVEDGRADGSGESSIGFGALFPFASSGSVRS